ncbi:hypothetical protein DJ90_6332 [Paenibacillus macerans]|uniref:Uncharacterized protein n=1 Tax=Paenibacillus macerans TaxID=44252 RepID=A0A090YBV8_PAEMA|nr:hypothetical protein DJ90_6332 [Paenibacillus macerans]
MFRVKRNFSFGHTLQLNDLQFVYQKAAHFFSEILHRHRARRMLYSSNTGIPQRKLSGRNDTARLQRTIHIRIIRWFSLNSADLSGSSGDSGGNGKLGFPRLRFRLAYRSGLRVFALQGAVISMLTHIPLAVCFRRLVPRYQVMYTWKLGGFATGLRRFGGIRNTVQHVLQRIQQCLDLR